MPLGVDALAHNKTAIRPSVSQPMIDILAYFSCRPYAPGITVQLDAERRCIQVEKLPGIFGLNS